VLYIKKNHNRYMTTFLNLLNKYKEYINKAMQSVYTEHRFILSLVFHAIY